MNQRVSPIVNMHIAPRRGLSWQEAAAFLKVSETEFKALASQRRLNGAINIDENTTVWDLSVLAINARPPRLNDRVGMIYVAGFAEYIKIGWSADVYIRIKTIQDGVPEPLIVYATIAGEIWQERRLHSRFASVRTRGEWFKRNEVLNRWIAEGCPL